MAELTDTDIREHVRERYAAAATAVAESTAPGCCGAPAAIAGCGPDITSTDKHGNEVFGATLYDDAGDPALKAAVEASLGCGVPTAVADLHEGETVLDLGSGAGADVLISARRVGETGRAIGLDMTDEMLALAEENRRKAGATNVTFLKGEIEHIPLPDASVDVIISNCVINLSGDKRQVLREAFRVLKPGGRFAVSDVVVRGDVPDAVRKNMELWIGCVAGALEEQEYRTLLADAGFEQTDVEVTRVYAADDAAAFLEGSGLDAAEFAREIDGKFVSAFVRATKPAGVEKASCCTGPECVGLPCCD